MISTRSFKLLLLLLATTLTACGFHVRGGDSLPAELKNIYLEGGSPAMREQVLQQLRNSHAQLVSHENASMVIKLFNEQFQRRGVSLSERGKTNEYELIYRIEYEITTPKEAVLLARQPLEVRRDYYNDQQAILARDNEETVLRSEMAQQVVRTLLNQARFTLDKSEK
jgi:LPS-assembly lipoprotein